jgi:hypothetical protein
MNDLQHGQLRVLLEPVRSVLRIGGSMIVIQSSQPVPSAWVRFWYRVLLGWEWEAR